MDVFPGRVRAKLLERVRDLLPGGDEWGKGPAGLPDPEPDAEPDPGARLRARPRGLTQGPDSGYELAMLRFREEHLLAGAGPPAQARRGPGTEARRCVLRGRCLGCPGGDVAVAGTAVGFTGAPVIPALLRRCFAREVTASPVHR